MTNNESSFVKEKSYNGLKKEERLYSLKQIESLFNEGGSHSLSAFPLRVVYRKVSREEESPAVQMLISVPKKFLHRAVKRNLVKRQVREAYRKNKHIIKQKPGHPVEGVDMAFIWQSDKLYDSKSVEKRVVNLLERINESL